MAQLANIIETPLPAADEELGDLRFRRLLGAWAWAELPPPVQRRFSKRLSGGRTAVYVGEVAEVAASLAGRVLATLTRLIGSPLPLVWQAPAPAVVTVTECDSGQQVWSRLYARRQGLPQMVHSFKRFDGPTGLEEHVGGGVGMALRISVEAGTLMFRSDHYFVAVFGRRLRLPRLLEPGQISVAHAELGDGRFAFTLDVRHPLLGALIHQHVVFREDA